MHETDKQILTILLQDARTPHVQIAEQVNLSRPAVTERIKKLESTGIIRGYSAVVDPQAIGLFITAFISAKHPGVLTEKTNEALERLRARPEIIEVHSIAGEDCFLIKVRTRDMKSLNKVVHKLKEPPLLMTTKTTIVLESFFEKIGGTTLT